MYARISGHAANNTRTYSAFCTMLLLTLFSYCSFTFPP